MSDIFMTPEQLDAVIWCLEVSVEPYPLSLRYSEQHPDQGIEIVHKYDAVIDMGDVIELINWIAVEISCKILEIETNDVQISDEDLDVVMVIEIARKIGSRMKLAEDGKKVSLPSIRIDPLVDDEVIKASWANMIPECAANELDPARA